MKLYGVCSLFILMLGNDVLAEHVSSKVVLSSVTKRITAKNTRSFANEFPIFRVISSYGSDLSSLSSASQLFVVPTATYTNVGILRFFGYTSTDGSCTGGPSQNWCDMTNGDNVTFTLGQTYVTSDSSMWNLQLQGCVATFGTVTEFDTKWVLYQLDGSTVVGNPSNCIQGTGVDGCTSTDCGWTSPQFWAP